MSIETLKPWILFTAAVSLDTLATVLFKHGSNKRVESSKLGWRGHIDNILGALKRIEITLGVLIYIVEYIVWIGFISTMPLSTAYPLSSVTIVLILLASWLLLGEKIGKNRLLGAALIISGMLLVGG